MDSQTSWSPNIVDQTAELAMGQKRRHCKQFPGWQNAVTRVADTSDLPPALPPVHFNALKLAMYCHRLGIATQWTSGSRQKPCPVVDFRGVPLSFSNYL